MAFKLVPVIMLLSVSAMIAAPSPGNSFETTTGPSFLGLRQERMTQFVVYWHDILSGQDPTCVVVLPPKSNTSFGQINMMDNALTSGVEINSTVVGRAQGIYAAASQQQLGFLMAMNFAFTEGKYNGSTLTVMGRNAAMTEVREMSIVGGSGLFRLARGYVEARTKWLDLKTGDATVEYTCYVLHY